MVVGLTSGGGADGGKLMVVEVVVKLMVVEVVMMRLGWSEC